jgi:hypothetical protein
VLGIDVLFNEQRVFTSGCSCFFLCEECAVNQRLGDELTCMESLSNSLSYSSLQPSHKCLMYLGFVLPAGVEGLLGEP